VVGASNTVLKAVFVASSLFVRFVLPPRGPEIVELVRALYVSA
jgi:hypothetical protein